MIVQGLNERLTCEFADHKERRKNIQRCRFQENLDVSLASSTFSHKVSSATMFGKPLIAKDTRALAARECNNLVSLKEARKRATCQPGKEEDERESSEVNRRGTKRRFTLLLCGSDKKDRALSDLWLLFIHNKASYFLSL